MIEAICFILYFVIGFLVAIGYVSSICYQKSMTLKEIRAEDTWGLNDCEPEQLIGICILWPFVLFILTIIGIVWLFYQALNKFSNFPKNLSISRKEEKEEIDKLTQILRRSKELQEQGEKQYDSVKYNVSKNDEESIILETLSDLGIKKKYIKQALKETN